MIVLLCLLGTFSVSLGQIVSSGKCLQPKPLKNFNWDDDVIGEWYEGWRTDNSLEPGFKCGKTIFSRGHDQQITEHLDAVMSSSGIVASFDGTVVFKDVRQPGQYFLKFPSFADDPGFDITFTDADWSSWVVKYSCTQVDDLKYETVWVHVKNLDTLDEKAIAKALKKLGIRLDDLIKVNHSRCPSWIV